MSKKTGLVLEGGAMRGMFTAGVIDVLMENGVDFPAMVGVSAGAAFGCNYKSRQPGRVIRYNKRFCQDKRYCSIQSLLKTGDLYGAEFCYRTIPEELDVFDKKTFEERMRTAIFGCARPLRCRWCQDPSRWMATPCSTAA